MNEAKPLPPFVTAKRQVRASRLDILDKTSSVHQSDLLGLIRLMHIVAGVWLITSPICTYYKTGHFVDVELAEAAFSNFWLLITTWVYAVIYSYTGYGLHVARLKFHLSKNVVYALLYIDTTLLLSSCLTIVRAVRWSVYPSVFIMSVAVIHLMKIHSFVDTTLSMEELSRQSAGVDAEKISSLTKGAIEEVASENLPTQRSNAVSGTASGQSPTSLEPPLPSSPAGVTSSYELQTSFKKFSQFLIVPRLVYEPEWPVANRPFRWSYFFGKIVLMISSLCSIFLVSANFVVPVMKNAHRTSYIHTFAELIVPLFLLDLLFFYVMFECILNLLAEICGYGDRDFYHDWWNSTTWEEFARKWNFPVHEFLLRHIYLPIYSYQDDRIGSAGGSRPASAKSSYPNNKQRKWFASFITILYSAIIHEFFLAATLGFVSWYMIIIMICQIPLFALSRFHKNTTFGNLFFCLGISIGVPFIAMLYGTDWSAHYYDGGSYVTP